MANHDGDGGCHHRVLAEFCRYEYRRDTFAPVAKDRQQGEQLTARAQDIRGANVSRADVANVSAPGEARENQTEWDGANQITRRGDERQNGEGWGKRFQNLILGSELENGATIDNGQLDLSLYRAGVIGGVLRFTPKIFFAQNPWLVRVKKDDVGGCAALQFSAR